MIAALACRMVSQGSPLMDRRAVLTGADDSALVSLPPSPEQGEGQGEGAAERDAKEADKP